MTKTKAVEILNKLFDSYLTIERMCLDTIIKVDGKQSLTLRDMQDEITDEKIALLTAIDALETPASSDYTYTEEYFNALEEAESALVKMQCLLDLIKHNGPQKKHPYFEGKIYRFKK